VYKHCTKRERKEERAGKNHIAAAVMNESIDWVDTDDNFLF